MKVCLFGTFEEEYPRNRTMTKGLAGSGFEIVRCHSPVWRGKTHKFGDLSGKSNALRRALIYLRAYLRISFRYLAGSRCDVIYIGYPGHLDVVVARILTLLRPAPIVFDVFLSLYDSFVLDRRMIPRGSMSARAFFLLDRWACKCADAVILDTRAHIEYFCREFDLPPGKFRRVFIGADDGIFAPAAPRRDDGLFRVGFVGKFTPLHGLEHIVRAAKLLESDGDIRFVIAGEGQLKEKIRRLSDELGAENISFEGWIRYEQVPAFLAGLDVCLGVFGGTDKASRVIPNKVFEAMAAARAVVTMKSRASDELLVDGRDALLCRPADPPSLADAIGRLKRDGSLRLSIAEGGRRTFMSACGSKNVSRQLGEIISEILEGK